MLGHEATGVVVKKGPNVKNLDVGDRIAVENHFYCGACYQCEVSGTKIYAEIPGSFIMFLKFCV